MFTNCVELEKVEFAATAPPPVGGEGEGLSRVGRGRYMYGWSVIEGCFFIACNYTVITL